MGIFVAECADLIEHNARITELAAAREAGAPPAGLF